MSIAATIVLISASLTSIVCLVRVLTFPPPPKVVDVNPTVVATIEGLESALDNVRQDIKRLKGQQARAVQASPPVPQFQTQGDELSLLRMHCLSLNEGGSS